MASMIVPASFLGGSATLISKQLPTSTAGRRSGAVLVRASRDVSDAEKIVMNDKDENGNGRREVMFAVAAGAACSLAEAALAGGEPRPGTPEAKKKYAPICVTMPTAKICHK